MQNRKDSPSQTPPASNRSSFEEELDRELAELESSFSAANEGAAQPPPAAAAPEQWPSPGPSPWAQAANPQPAAYAPHATAWMHGAGPQRPTHAPGAPPPPLAAGPQANNPGQYGPQLGQYYGPPPPGSQPPPPAGYPPGYNPGAPPQGYAPHYVHYPHFHPTHVQMMGSSPYLPVVVREPSRSPEVAALFSAIIPGLGQMYNQQVGKGLMFLGATLVGWMALIGWAFHIWSVVDAFQEGRRQQRRALPPAPPPHHPGMWTATPPPPGFPNPGAPQPPYAGPSHPYPGYPGYPPQGSGSR